MYTGMHRTWPETHTISLFLLKTIIFMKEMVSGCLCFISVLLKICVYIYLASVGHRVVSADIFIYDLFVLGLFVRCLYMSETVVCYCIVSLLFVAFTLP